MLKTNFWDFNLKKWSGTSADEMKKSVKKADSVYIQETTNLDHFKLCAYILTINFTKSCVFCAGAEDITPICRGMVVLKNDEILRLNIVLSDAIMNFDVEIDCDLTEEDILLGRNRNRG